jgi:hypothetical protein
MDKGLPELAPDYHLIFNQDSHMTDCSLGNGVVSYDQCVGLQVYMVYVPRVKASE